MLKLSKGWLTAAAAATLLFPAVAHAEEAPTSTLTPTVAVTAGSLGWTAAPSAGNFGPVKLDGSTQTTYAPLEDWGVDDERGTAAGWNVTASATPLTDSSNEKTLPYGLLTMNAPDHVSSESGVESGDAPAIDDTSTPLDNEEHTAVEVASAKAGTGMAKWAFAQANSPNGDLALTIPASTLAGEYTTTITFTIGDTP
jgi:hypothetical protein